MALRVASNVVWVMLVLGLAFVAIGKSLAEFLVQLVCPGFEGVMAAFTVYLSGIIFPMMVFQVLSGVIAGILLTHAESAVPTAAGLVQNAAAIASMLFFGRHYSLEEWALALCLVPDWRVR
ncbi:MAG: hypothetical protein GX162_13920 [Firmicutes bacterium]|nr:hypothetical protein [Bacillota bacterium]